MDVDRFISAHRPTWDRLDEIISRAGRGASRLSATEIDELVRLYQRTSTHLSTARTTYADPALVAELSTRVGRAAAVIYGTKSRSLRALAEAAVATFPAALWQLRWFVVAAALVFLVPAAGIALWLGGSPAALEIAGPEGLREAYVEEDFEAYYSENPSPLFATQVTTNNIQVGILAFALGILLCLPTVAVLALNGANVGVAAGLFIAADEQLRFWGLILPHGLLELTAVFIAGAAGLRLGWTVIDPGDRTRPDALVAEGRRTIVVVLGVAVVFVIAGLIEGFVSGSTLPTATRVGIGAAAWAAFVVYVVGLGRAAARRGLTGALGERRSGPGMPSGAPTPQSLPVAFTSR